MNDLMDFVKKKVSEACGIRRDAGESINPMAVGAGIVVLCGATYLAVKQFEDTKQMVQLRMEEIQRTYMPTMPSAPPVTSVRSGLPVEEVVDDDVVVSSPACADPSPSHGAAAVSPPCPAKPVVAGRESATTSKSKSGSEAAVPKSTSTSAATGAAASPAPAAVPLPAPPSTAALDMSEERQQEHVAQIRGMFTQLRECIGRQDYATVVQYTMALPQLFAGVDTADATTAFTNIERSDIPGTLDSILVRTDPSVSSLCLSTPAAVQVYNSKVMQAQAGDVIIIKASMSLLQTASQRPVTEIDFKTNDIYNFMGIKLDGVRMLMLMLQPQP